jgi:hypothetical protein
MFRTYWGFDNGFFFGHLHKITKRCAYEMADLVLGVRNAAAPAGPLRVSGLSPKKRQAQMTEMIIL